MSPKLLAALVFLTAYVLLVFRKGHPAIVAWSGAALLLVLRVMTIQEALGSISVNVLGIFMGTMILSDFFIHSQVPAYLAAITVSRSKTVAVALTAVCVLAGVVSSVVDNVATVLMIAPIALEIAQRLNISPVSFIVGIAVSANLEGAATMVGDSTSILLASASGMSFADFFWADGRPGIFFAVQIAAIGAFIVLYRIFLKHKGTCESVPTVHVSSWVPTALMVLMMIAMALSSMIPQRPDWAVGAIALATAAIALIWNAATHYKEISLIRDPDWATVLLLSGLFVLIGSLTTTGLVGDIAGLISNIAKGNSFLAYMVIVWMSVLLSAFIDNIPYTMAMLPVAQIVSTSMGTSPWVMMFGLLLGTTLGGNITPIGASANVVAVSLLRKNGHNVSFMEFAKIGLPFTLVAVTIGSLFNWFVWK